MKNLEEAYKKSQQEELPDLWDRIEAGLPEKKKKKSMPLTVLPYCSVAAAALLLAVLVIPPLSRQSVNESSDMAAQDSANGEDIMWNGAISTSQTPEPEFEAEGSQSADMAAEDNDTALDGMEDFDGLLEAPIMDDAAVPETPMVEDATVSETPHITKRLLVSEAAEMEGGSIYTLTDADSTIFLAFYANDLGSTLVVGESYVFTLREEAGEGWEYVIESVE